VHPPVFGRRHADELGERRAEGSQAAEADEVADLGDGQIRRAQQVLGALHAAPGEVCTRRLAVGDAERAGEVVAGEAGRARHGVQVERLGEVPVDQVAGTSQVEHRRDDRTAHALIWRMDPTNGPAGTGGAAPPVVERPCISMSPMWFCIACEVLSPSEGRTTMSLRGPTD
jgi:hypothetical protein